MLVLTSLEVLSIDVVGTGTVVDGWTDSIDVVTGLNVLTLSDDETTELELLDVKAELDDGVDDEVLTNGVLLISLDEVSTIDVVGVCKVVDGWTDSIDVVTGLNVLTLSDVETTELELLDVKAELDDGVDDEVSAMDVVSTGTVVDGSTDAIHVVTGFYVLTLSDDATTELELLDVKAELDDGADDEVLTKGLEVVTICDCVLSTDDSV